MLLALSLGRRREKLAQYFPVAVRVALGGLVVTLAAQGILVLVSIYMLAISEVLVRTTWIIVAFGAGLVFSAFMIVTGWRDLLAIPPLPVRGVVVDAQRMPELIERIGQLAQRLGAKPPSRVIVGLQPTAFVSTRELRLNGSELLSPAETLYLSILALRAFSDSELDALIGHELAHFRGKDSGYSERFIPVYRALVGSYESASPDGEGFSLIPTLARLPAISLLEGMYYVLDSSVSRISREREHEADRAAAQLSKRAVAPCVRPCAPIRRRSRLCVRAARESHNLSLWGPTSGARWHGPRMRAPAAASRQIPGRSVWPSSRKFTVLCTRPCWSNRSSRRCCRPARLRGRPLELEAIFVVRVVAPDQFGLTDEAELIGLRAAHVQIGGRSRRVCIEISRAAGATPVNPHRGPPPAAMPATCVP